MKFVLKSCRILMAKNLFLTLVLYKEDNSSISNADQRFLSIILAVVIRFTSIFFRNRSYWCRMFVQYLGNVISNLACRFRPFLTVFCPLFWLWSSDSLYINCIYILKVHSKIKNGRARANSFTKLEICV